MLAIALLAAVTTGDPAVTTEKVTIEVDATKVVQVISPLVYGINGNDYTKRPYIPFSRSGGNRMTAYNWENNASNAGADWHHQNDDYLGGGGKPGEVIRSYVAPVMAHGKTCIVTVPMAGYVAADKKGDGDVKQTSNYLETRFVKSYAKKNAPFQYPPDLNDKAVYQDEFVWWLNREFPAAKRNGGQIFYDMDNEPDIWAGTHNRIHPNKVTYAEMVERTTELASAIKDVVPDAVIFGFVSYGYAGYMHLQGAPDGHGRDFIEFFLGAMREQEKTHGKRLMDVLDLHWYPEARGGGKRITDNTIDPPLVRARVQAPRSLWDPNYAEDSWITKDVLHGPIVLLPTLKQKVEKCYPGTKLAFTEYDYGGANDVSGAVTEADVLGIFGEQGVFAASIWGGGPFQFAAFDLYVNYDGKGGHFADGALRASSSRIEDVAVHASRPAKGDGPITMVLVNRAEAPRTCTLDVKGASFAKATLYRIAGREAKVKLAGSVPIQSGGTLELPAMSATTVVLEP